MSDNEKAEAVFEFFITERNRVEAERDIFKLNQIRRIIVALDFVTAVKLFDAVTQVSDSRS